MTTTPPAPHADDIECARMIVDDIKIMSDDALKVMIGNMRSTYPTLDPLVALITLTHCDLIDDCADDDITLPPLTPFVIMLALTDLT